MEESMIQSCGQEREILKRTPDQIRLFAVTIGKMGAEQRINLYNMYLKAAVEVRDLCEAILQMDELMETMGFPMAASEMRSFCRKKKNVSDERRCLDKWKPRLFPVSEKEGFLLYINVLYRQSNTWQGEVICKEKKEKKYFRSVLELLHLIQSAIGKEGECE